MKDGFADKGMQAQKLVRSDAEKMLDESLKTGLREDFIKNTEL